MKTTIKRQKEAQLIIPENEVAYHIHDQTAAMSVF